MPSPLESTEVPSSVREAPRDAVPLLLRPSTVYAALAVAWAVGAWMAYDLHVSTPMWRPGMRSGNYPGAVWELLGTMTAEIAGLVAVLRPSSFHRAAKVRAGLAVLFCFAAVYVLARPLDAGEWNVANVRWLWGIGAVLFVVLFVAPWPPRGRREIAKMTTETRIG